MASKIELVVATLNVSFSEDEGDKTGAGIKLEIDDREDGLNGEDTSFSPGDDVYFFMYVDETKIDLITTIPKTTAGGVSTANPSSAITDADENISFSNSNEGSLSYSPYGSVSLEWLGKAFEVQKVVTNNSTTYNLLPYTALPELDGIKLSTPDGKKVIGLLKATYQKQGSLWKLSSVPIDILEAVIIAIGTTKP